MFSIPPISPNAAEQLALMWLSNQDTTEDTPSRLAEKFVKAYDEILDIVVIDKPNE